MTHVLTPLRLWWRDAGVIDMALWGVIRDRHFRQQITIREIERRTGYRGTRSQNIRCRTLESRRSNFPTDHVSRTRLPGN